MSKLFLCGITSAGNEKNLREMIEPIRKYFNGLCFTFHNPVNGDAGALFLEEQKGDGAIIYANWCKRHGFSMQQFLWQGPMEEGDKFIYLDTLERISPDFCENVVPEIVKSMDNNNIAMVANYQKGLVFRFNDQLEFRGSPHWYATQLDGNAVNMELQKSDFWNVRNEQRDEYEWVSHYAKYFLYPQGSNHALLGLDHHKGGTPQEIFPKREAKRLWFLTQMKRAGFSRDLAGLKAFFSQPLTQELVELIQSDKTWSDFYHYTILGDNTVVHSHKPEDMKPLSLPAPSVKP